MKDMLYLLKSAWNYIIKKTITNKQLLLPSSMVKIPSVTIASYFQGADFVYTCLYPINTLVKSELI